MPDVDRKIAKPDIARGTLPVLTDFNGNTYVVHGARKVDLQLEHSYISISQCRVLSCVNALTHIDDDGACRTYATQDSIKTIFEGPEPNGGLLRKLDLCPRLVEISAVTSARTGAETPQSRSVRLQLSSMSVCVVCVCVYVCV